MNPNPNLKNDARSHLIVASEVKSVVRATAENLVIGFVAAVALFQTCSATASVTTYQGNAATESAWRIAAGGNVPLEDFESYSGTPGPCSNQSDSVTSLPALGVTLRGITKGSYPGVYVNASQAHSGIAQLANFGFDPGCAPFLDYYIEAVPGRAIKSAGLWQCDPQGDLTIVAEDMSGQMMFSFVALINNGSGNSFGGFTSTLPVARLRVLGAGGDGWNHLDDLQIVTEPVCPGDVTGDSQVNANDLLVVINGWGPCGKTCAADVTGDGAVNANDLLVVINHWGPCPN